MGRRPVSMRVSTCARCTRCSTVAGCRQPAEECEVGGLRFRRGRTTALPTEAAGARRFAGGIQVSPGLRYVALAMSLPHPRTISTFAAALVLASFPAQVTAASSAVECGQISAYTAPDPVTSADGALTIGFLPAWVIAPDATMSPSVVANLPSVVNSGPSCLAMDPSRTRPRSGHPSKHRQASSRRPAGAVGPQHRAVDLPRTCGRVARCTRSGAHLSDARHAHPSGVISRSQWTRWSEGSDRLR